VIYVKPEKAVNRKSAFCSTRKCVRMNSVDLFRHVSIVKTLFGETANVFPSLPL